MSEDIEASYPDLGLVIDSKEGSPEESEEVEDGAGEGGPASNFNGAPLPKHFGQVLGTCWGAASGWGHIWQYQVLMYLISPLSWSELSKVFR